MKYIVPIFVWYSTNIFVNMETCLYIVIACSTNIFVNMEVGSYSVIACSTDIFVNMEAGSCYTVIACSTIIFCKYGGSFSCNVCSSIILENIELQHY